jgi:hypothetical protein
MKPSDFFTFPAEVGDSEISWGMAPLHTDLLEHLRRGAVDGVKDLGAAIGLAQLAHEELEKYGTSGGTRLDDAEMALVLKALKATLRRLRVPYPGLPFRNLTTFRS